MPSVMTLLGEVEVSQVGITDFHEHVISQPPRQFPGWQPDLVLDDIDAAVRELDAFAAVAGTCVVDATTIDSVATRRQPRWLAAARSTVEGAPTDVGPMSTVLGAAVLTAVVVEATAALVRRGVTPPLFASQNVEGVDDYNDALNDRHRGRIRALP